MLTILIDGLTYASWLFIVALGLTLVTDNVREFGRVAGLVVENWLATDA